MKSYVGEPITLTVEKGFVTGIEGAQEAEMLLEYIESFGDPEAYAISHIGWGLQKRAYWSTLGLYDREGTIGMDARAVSGNFLFSLGPNNEAGGDRTRPATSTSRCAAARSRWTAWTSCATAVVEERMTTAPAHERRGGRACMTGRQRSTHDRASARRWRCARLSAC